jgi:hypothetical protein
MELEDALNELGISLGDFALIAGVDTDVAVMWHKGSDVSEEDRKKLMAAANAVIAEAWYRIFQKRRALYEHYREEQLFEEMLVKMEEWDKELRSDLLQRLKEHLAAEPPSWAP